MERAKQLAAQRLQFSSPTGLRISVGRNHTQNDLLTMKQAGRMDLWFHVKDIHGAHVVLWTEGRVADEESLYAAACLAAYFSQAGEGDKVPVDYTQVKFVKKPAGAKPGQVIYSEQKTLYVAASEKDIAPYRVD